MTKEKKLTAKLNKKQQIVQAAIDESKLTPNRLPELRVMGMHTALIGSLNIDVDVLIAIRDALATKPHDPDLLIPNLQVGIKDSEYAEVFIKCYKELQLLGKPKGHKLVELLSGAPTYLRNECISCMLTDYNHDFWSTDIVQSTSNRLYEIMDDLTPDGYSFGHCYELGDALGVWEDDPA